MSTIFRTATTHAGATGRHRVKAVCLLICLTVSVFSTGAQAERMALRKWVATSNLNSFFNRHLVRLTIVEKGATTATSRVVIELRDRANRVVARKEGSLTSRSPVQLDLKLGENAGLIQLSATVMIEFDGDEFTAPLVTFEDINPDLGLVAKIDPPCGPGSGHVDPQAYCPGWHEITSPE